MARITVVPASTRAGQETIRALLSSDSESIVRAIYRDTTKAPLEFTGHSRFEAIQGDIVSGEILDFSTSDAVLYIPPPTYDGTDQAEFATRAASNIKTALEASQVRLLVIHSAMGAQHSSGVGVLKLNHVTDSLLKDAVSQVRIVKPAYYYQNWLEGLQKDDSARFTLTMPIDPVEHKVPMVSVQDVGRYCAEALLDTERQSGTSSVDIYGPRLYSATDVKTAIQNATGKHVDLVTVPRDELSAFFSHHVPAVYVPEFAEMVAALHPGGLMTQDFGGNEQTLRGEVELADSYRSMHDEGRF